MQKLNKIILTSLLTVVMTLQAFGEIPADSVKVYFHVGHSAFDPSLRNNRAVMDSFVNIVREAKASDNINRLLVSGYASPDGTSDANDRLARLRCEAIADYISQHTGVSRDMIQTIPGGVAWGELRSMVEAAPDVPSREKVLNILDNTPIWIYDSNGKIIDGRKAQLMSLDRGDTYRWMLIHLFPELRNAVGLAVFLKSADSKPTVIADLTEKAVPETEVITSEIDYSETILSETNVIEETNFIEETVVIDETVIPYVPDTAVIYDESLIKQSSSFYMAAKTNMLFDAALVPNLGAEFYLGKNISLYCEWMYAWWDNNPHHRYWRIYGGDLGLRWWFGRKANEKPLTGHHLGIYGGILTFDFEIGDTGYLGGKPGGTLWDRWLLNTGIEYGYSLPIAKRLNIDFSIGLGYMGGNYIKYYPFDNDYYFDKEYKMQYFGPTKAEISLVWLIGKGNTNSKKGGDR